MRPPLPGPTKGPFLRRSSGLIVPARTPSYGARPVAANSEYLSIADASQTGLDFGTGDFSIGIWFYLDALSVDMGLMSKKNAATNSSDAGWNLALLGSSNVLQMRFIDDSGAGIVTLNHGTALSENTLYFTVVTFDRDGNMGISLNAGAEATASIAAKAGSVSNAIAFMIGRRAATAGTYFTGGLVCAFAANALLDSTDRTALYNSGSPLLYSAVGATQQAKMISYWNLDEQSDGSGAVTRNDSKGTNHLTDKNTTPSSAFPFTG